MASDVKAEAESSTLSSTSTKSRVDDDDPDYVEMQVERLAALDDDELDDFAYEDDEDDVDDAAPDEGVEKTSDASESSSGRFSRDEDDDDAWDEDDFDRVPEPAPASKKSSKSSDTKVANEGSSSRGSERTLRATLGLRRVPARAFGAFERDALAAGVSKFVSDKSSGACSSDDIVVDAKVSETTASSRGGGGGAARRLAARDDDFFDDGANAFRIAGETDLRVTVTCRRVPSAASGKKAEAAVRAGAKDGSLADALADVGLRVGDGLYLVDAETSDPGR